MTASMDLSCLWRRTEVNNPEKFFPRGERAFFMRNNLTSAPKAILWSLAIILCSFGAAFAQHGQTGGGGAGASATASAAGTMKVTVKKPVRTTTGTARPPRTGARTTPDNSAQLEDALSLADDARQNGRNDAAERGYLLASKLVPSDPRAYLGLGHLFYNQKKYPDAEKAYARAAALSRNDSEPYARLAFTYTEMQRLAEGLSAAQRAVAAQPDNYYGYLALGYVLSLQHSYAASETAYRKAVTLAPNPVVILHTELARILSEQRKYREASVEAKKAVDLDPKDYSARFQYALLLQKLGQLVPSAAEYLEAIKINEKDGSPHSNVGLIYYMTERFTAARQHWNAAIALGSTYDPDRIGIMILDGRLADARRELEAYTQKTPDDEDGWLMLGDVYRALGEDSLARVTDTRAAQIAPEYVGLRRPSLAGISAPARNTPRNTPVTAEVAVVRAYMLKNYPAAASEATSSFLTSDRTIHCVIELSQAKTGTPVKFVWSTMQVEGAPNRMIKTVDYSTKPGEDRVHGNLTLPNDWPPGTYKVEIYVNNTLAKSIRYSIQ
jgi:tetratricopeptide (TPR) repeat protein